MEILYISDEDTAATINNMIIVLKKYDLSKNANTYIMLRWHDEYAQFWARDFVSIRTVRAGIPDGEIRTYKISLKNNEKLEMKNTIKY
ncbi:hypothetical protein [Microcystis phage Mel-JY01]